MKRKYRCYWTLGHSYDKDRNAKTEEREMRLTIETAESAERDRSKFVMRDDDGVIQVCNTFDELMAWVYRNLHEHGYAGGSRAEICELVVRPSAINRDNAS